MGRHRVRSILFLIISFLALGFLVLSFVSLGGANDAHAKYPDWKIVTTESLTSLQSELLSQSLSFDVVDKNDGLVEDENEEEEEERPLPPEEGTSLMFIYHYTTAAVCFSIFIVVAILAGISLGYYSERDRDLCYLWVFLLVIPFVVVPAVRMDGFSTITYWVFFIPYLLLALAPPILFFCCMISDDWEEASFSLRCESFALGLVAYILFLTGLILCILRLDNTLPPSFKYTFIFSFPAVGFFCVSIPCLQWFFRGLGSSNVLDEELRLCDDVVAGAGASFVITLILFGAFFLPFLLRKDLVFQTSYQFTLIPFYLLILGLLISATVLTACLLCDDD